MQKPLEKRYIRREIAFYPIVSKMAVFGKVAKGGGTEGTEGTTKATTVDLLRMNTL